MLAHCLMTNPADRPSAVHLLRHRFFAKRAARDAPALVSALLLRLPAQVQPNDIFVNGDVVLQLDLLSTAFRHTHRLHRAKIA